MRLCNKYSTVNNFNKPSYNFTLCMLNNVLDFCYHLLTFNQINFLKKSNTIRVPNGLYPDQNRSSVGTELGLNYTQMLSADKKRVGITKAAKHK